MMRSLESSSVSNLQFTVIRPATNGTIVVTLAWPDEGLSTNVVDIFACTDLSAGKWVLADTLTLDMQTNHVAWVDTASTNHTVRFYDAWTHHDSDGDGIPDGREVRLFGTDRHQWDSDSDGLSDFAELFVHGTSALNADSDGDGLPDGWEIQYGIDPLDATGANGANGDPDGDGFTNQQEFQMGGDPTNPAINASQLIHRLMHCRGSSSLRVDIEDSANCGGTNPNRQDVEDIFNIGPLMHCGYLLSLTVKGRVEDESSGYDKVSVRPYTSTELQSEVPFFEGHNNGNRCAMVDEQATTNVWFWSNGSIRLRYDTGDGLYHTDAYAEITAATLASVFEMEIEVNDTADEEDDVVCRYSTNPAGRPTIPCRARVRGKGSGSVPIVLSGSKIRFSDDADTTTNLSLPEDGSWVSFENSGQIESTAKNDAVIEARLASATGSMCGSEDFAWYMRLTSEKVSPSGTGSYVHHTRPGHPTDNAAGAGSTIMSVD